MLNDKVKRGPSPHFSPFEGVKGDVHNALASVVVNFVDKEGASLGSSPATLKKPWKNEWVSQLPLQLSPAVTTIMITAKDKAGNISHIRHWRQGMLEAA